MECQRHGSSPLGHRAHKRLTAVDRNVTMPRFQELAQIATDVGRGWQAKHRLPIIDETSYKEY